MLPMALLLPLLPAMQLRPTASLCSSLLLYPS